MNRFTTKSTVLTLSPTMASMINGEATITKIASSACNNDWLQGTYDVTAGNEVIVSIGKKYIRGYEMENPNNMFFTPIKSSTLGASLYIEAKRAMDRTLGVDGITMAVYRIALIREIGEGPDGSTCAEYINPATQVTWMHVCDVWSEGTTVEEFDRFNTMWKQTYGGLVSYDSSSIKDRYPETWDAFSSLQSERRAMA
jgi:hypothetical protein